MAVDTIGCDRSAGPVHWRPFNFSRPDGSPLELPAPDLVDPSGPSPIQPRLKRLLKARRARSGGPRPPANRKQKKLLLDDEGRDAMRRAGRVNAQLMDFLRERIAAGVKTIEIDEWVVGWTRDHGHSCATLGYQNFPKSCCTSINEVICHGIPNEDDVLTDGDIVNVDITTVVDGWHGDQSETFVIGETDETRRAVTQAAFDCMWLAIDSLQPGCRVAAIGEAIVPEAHRRGFTVVREYVGHGVGRSFHLDPSIPHFPNRQARMDRLLPGMCFTVEPMINAGSRYTRCDKSDGWTVRTKDGKPSAQFEHSVLMTEDGPEVLTLTEHGPRRGHRF